MIIRQARLGMLRAPLTTPFRTALRSVGQVEDLVLLLQTDCGHCGYGSAPSTPVITGDDHASILRALREHYLPALQGREVADLQAGLACIAGIDSGPNARAAVEMALYDLQGQLQGQPLYRLLGGDCRQLRTDITISVDEPATMAASARDALARGFTQLKLKTGGHPEQDIARVMAVFEAVGERAVLRLDANQGWTAQQAIYAIRSLEQAGVRLELVEQPVRAGDLLGMSRVRQNLDTPVAADESAFDATQMAQVLDERAADIINIKLMKSGGISGALAMAGLAAQRRVQCMMGCMLESRIGVTAAAHVAAARADVITLVDLDVPMLCSAEPVRGGVRYDGPDITLNETPGLGIEGLDGVEWL